MIDPKIFAELGQYISEKLPDHEFLLLVTPMSDLQKIAIASSLPKHLQPLLAQAFVAGCAGLESGAFVGVRLTPDVKSH